MRLLRFAFAIVVLLTPHAATASANHTDVILFSPWSESQEIRSDLHVTKRVLGHCWTASLSASRPDAWRCQTDTTRPETFGGKTYNVNDLYDPCFSGAMREVACVVNPFDKSVILMRLSKPVEGPSAPLDKRRPPWAVRLVNGATCEFLTGATGVVAGMRINYGCSNGASLLGEPDRTSQPWTIYYAKSQSDPDVTQIAIVTAVF
ncbi:MAG: hypothetical protein ACYCUI_11125 [Vulcanimicrobiaceae bacterium]